MPVARRETSDCRVIGHVDMDCFYVQVEQRKEPKLRGVPTAVVQYNSYKGGGLIAVSYEARAHGVKRSMRGDEAKEACPQIQLVQVPVARGKADLNTYRSAGSEVVSILSRKGRCERASIDEVYLDLTDAAEAMFMETPPESMEDIQEEVTKSHVLGLQFEDGNDPKEEVRKWLCRSDASYQDKLLACAAFIIADLRMQVLKETEFTCSAGIAHNKMLAKLASAMNKPAQQTVVPHSSVAGLLESLPIKKMKQLGGKLGSSLQSDLGVNTVGDLLQFSEEKLQQRYGINTGTWLWNIARGISGEEVEGRLLPKSHGSGKTFPGPQTLKTIGSVQHWINELCEELSERLHSDLEQNKRIAHTLTLHARAYKTGVPNSNRKFPSKSCPLRYGTIKIQEDALTLFQAALREFMGFYNSKTNWNENNKWGITSLSVSASKIVPIPSQRFISRFKNGVAMDPAKIESVLQWPVPKNVKGVQGFLGLTGYYRKFIKDYGKLAKPLTELTKKEGFKWNDQAQMAIELLKEKITTAPILALPDFDQQFVIESDASGVGVGAILMQDKRPIAYFSKALSVRNLTKLACEKELMALALAIQHWRPYFLVGNYKVEESLPQGLEGEQVTITEPAKVLASRKVNKRGEEIQQYLIQWKESSAEDATWEDEYTIRSQFPIFSLEDRTAVEEASNDRYQTNPRGPLSDQLSHGPKVWNVYVRRKKKGVAEGTHSIVKYFGGQTPSGSSLNQPLDNVIDEAVPPSSSVRYPEEDTAMKHSQDCVDQQDPLCNLSSKVDGLTEESSLISPTGSEDRRKQSEEHRDLPAKKPRGNCSITKFFNNYPNSQSSLEQKNVTNAQGSRSARGSYLTSDEVEVEMSAASSHGDIVKNVAGCSAANIPHGRQAWSYNIDEIDPSIIRELPPEIQEEIQTWLQPQKRPNVVKRGSSITNYFLPDNSR
ncbi:unnamed protein product [Lupinus luteus]|uniref:DNA polymerase eta n=1 Tax=Lupinus luteus TaxID=3873 RepID=A0AAV1Y750_LUPLU